MQQVHSNMDFAKGDEIFKEIDEDDAAARDAEITRLIRSRRGYKSSFTRSANALTVLVESSQHNGLLDRSKSTQEAISRERERMEVRYEKLQTLNTRILRLNRDEDEEENYEGQIDQTFEQYCKVTKAIGALMIELLPQGAGGNNNASQANAPIRPMVALQPSFRLSFDNSPTEKAHWIDQFRSYYEASRFHLLDLPQQQAFLRQGVHPDVWTAISQYVTLDTPIFHGPDDLEEESSESLLEEAFAIRYPLIMRRYKFFTYTRRGNQTFTNFHAKLRELALAAQLEHMSRDDYLMFRVICGLNDDKTVEKLLAIPSVDFTMEEVHRVATSCEAASNYTKLGKSNQTHQTTGSSSGGKGKKKQPSINQKLKEMKEKGKCCGCGKKVHEKDEECPHKTTTCHNCGKKGHISPVCAQSKSNKKGDSKGNKDTTNYTFSYATHGSRPSPTQFMSFQDQRH